MIGVLPFIVEVSNVEIACLFSLASIGVIMSDPRSVVLDNVGYKHVAVDSITNQPVKLITKFDRHGMTVELPNGKCVTFDVSEGYLTIRHCDDAMDVDVVIGIYDLTVVPGTQQE